MALLVPGLLTFDLLQSCSIEMLFILQNVAKISVGCFMSFLIFSYVDVSITAHSIKNFKVVQFILVEHVYIK